MKTTTARTDDPTYRCFDTDEKATYWDWVDRPDLHKSQWRSSQDGYNFKTGDRCAVMVHDGYNGWWSVPAVGDVTGKKMDSWKCNSTGGDDARNGDAGVSVFR